MSLRTFSLLCYYYSCHRWLGEYSFPLSLLCRYVFPLFSPIAFPSFFKFMSLIFLSLSFPPFSLHFGSSLVPVIHFHNPTYTFSSSSLIHFPSHLFYLPTLSSILSLCILSIAHWVFFQHYICKIVSKPSSATIAQVVLFISSCNMFWPIWWPSSGESYKLFKEATIPTMDLLCFSTNFNYVCKLQAAVVFVFALY
jgi:hypothetical protein